LTRTSETRPTVASYVDRYDGIDRTCRLDEGRDRAALDGRGYESLVRCLAQEKVAQTSHNGADQNRADQETPHISMTPAGTFAPMANALA
jgi:hypothetical protein